MVAAGYEPDHRWPTPVHDLAQTSQPLHGDHAAEAEQRLSVVYDKLFRPERWHQHAACAGMKPAMFYPPRGEPAAEAKAVCRRCPVARECLAAALARPERYGVWGATTERERRAQRKVAAPEISRCEICGTRLHSPAGEPADAVCYSCAPQMC